ncbi:MAG: DUF6702 family protein [Weeksellaceae bacterium]
MKKWFWLILVFVSGFLLASDTLTAHPYHVGTVEINYDKATKTYQVTARFFLDDLEDAINLKRKSPLYFYKPNQKALMQNALQQYMKAHLVIKGDDKNVPLRFLGYEENQESVYIYLESSEMPTPSTVTVGANALYDLFDDQINIIHIKINGHRKSHKLNYPDIYFTKQF